MTSPYEGMRRGYHLFLLQGVVVAVDGGNVHSVWEMREPCGDDFESVVGRHWMGDGRGRWEALEVRPMARYLWLL